MAGRTGGARVFLRRLTYTSIVCQYHTHTLLTTHTHPLVAFTLGSRPPQLRLAPQSLRLAASRQALHTLATCHRGGGRGCEAGDSRGENAPAHPAMRVLPPPALPVRDPGANGCGGGVVSYDRGPLPLWLWGSEAVAPSHCHHHLSHAHSHHAPPPLVTRTLTPRATTTCHTHTYPTRHHQLPHLPPLPAHLSPFRDASATTMPPVRLPITGLSS